MPFFMVVGINLGVYYEVGLSFMETKIMSMAQILMVIDVWKGLVQDM